LGISLSAPKVTKSNPVAELAAEHKAHQEQLKADYYQREEARKRKAKRKRGKK
jgi:hypothetical protein